MTKEQTTDARYDALVIHAQNLGRDAGENAAAWWRKGAKSATRSVYGFRTFAARLLATHDAGGVHVDWPVTPNLSGEWADSMTPYRLYAQLGCDPDEDGDDMGICQAWEDAASEAFEDAILEYLRSAATV